MSSVFLYVAIVAIWAFVLVPRWLRRQHAAPQPGYEAGYQPGAADYEDSYGPQDGAADGGADAYGADGYGTDAYGADGYGTDAPSGPAMSAPASAATPAYAAGGSPAAYASQSRQHERVQATAQLSRSRVLQARRRLLTMLVLLAAAAGTCTVLKLTAWWICIPPATMLGMYLLLLREAAIADAERARWLADIAYRAWAEREREGTHRTAQAPAEQPTAEIIDISARVGDMVYDQYADAAVRAVGD